MSMSSWSAARCASRTLALAFDISRRTLDVPETVNQGEVLVGVVQARTVKQTPCPEPLTSSAFSPCPWRVPRLWWLLRKALRAEPTRKRARSLRRAVGTPPNLPMAYISNGELAAARQGRCPCVSMLCMGLLGYDAPKSGAWAPPHAIPLWMPRQLLIEHHAHAGVTPV